VSGALIVLVLVAVLVFVIALSWDAAERARVRTELEAIAKELGGTAEQAPGGAQRARATIDGVTVTYALAIRGSGKHAQRWTEVEVEVPTRYPLSILVRRHEWLDGGKISRGEMVDVVLGDRAFDDAFLVEVAPADVVSQLLDRPIRELLWSLENPELLTTKRDGKPVVQLAVRDWIRERDAAVRIARKLAVLGASVRGAYATAAAATPVTYEGVPFREIANDRAARQAERARVEEVQHVEEVRAVRKHNEQYVVAIVVVGLLAISLLLLIALR
jgi:hypothetical protein